MRTASSKKSGDRDTMRTEYDFTSMKGGVRGKYAKAYRAGTNLVLLDPEVYAAFPSAEAVNSALRACLAISKVAKPARVKKG
jgi:hypothetical protein